MQFRILLLILILSGCSSKPTTLPESDITAAEKVAHATFNEFEITEAENDLTGVSEETAGGVKALIPDLNVSDMTEYKTGEPGWIEVTSTQVFPWSVPRPKAKGIILMKLRNEAITKKVAATVEVTSLLTDVMGQSGGKAYEQTAWSGFFKSTVSGVITNQTEMKNELRDLGAEKGYELEMTYRFFVEPVHGQRDPGFHIDVQLESNILKEGQELAFSVKPSKECYLYAFNLMADHNALLMFPNEYMKENYIQAGEVIQIPNPQIRNYVKFVLGMMLGETLTTESIYVVCTKQPVPAIEDLPRIGTSMQVFSVESKSFINLQRWLTNIPLDQRVEKNLVYHVTK